MLLKMQLGELPLKLPPHRIYFYTQKKTEAFVILIHKYFSYLFSLNKCMLLYSAIVCHTHLSLIAI